MKKLFFLQFLLLISFFSLETIFPMQNKAAKKVSRSTKTNKKTKKSKEEQPTLSVDQQKTEETIYKYGQREDEIPYKGYPAEDTKLSTKVAQTSILEEKKQKESTPEKIKSFIEGIKQKKINKQIEKTQKQIDAISEQIKKSETATLNKETLEQKIIENKNKLPELQKQLNEIQIEINNFPKNANLKNKLKQTQTKEQNLKNEIDQLQKEINDAENQLKDELNVNQLNYLKQQQFKLNSKLSELKGEAERDKDRETQVKVAEASSSGEGEKGGFITGTIDKIKEHSTEIIGGSLVTAIVGGLTAGGGGIAGIAAATSDEGEGSEGGAEYEEYIDDIEVDIGVYKEVPKLRKKINSGLAAGTNYLNDEEE